MLNNYWNFIHLNWCRDFLFDHAVKNSKPFFFLWQKSIKREIQSRILQKGPITPRRGRKGYRHRLDTTAYFQKRKTQMASKILLLRFQIAMARKQRVAIFIYSLWPTVSLVFGETVATLAHLLWSKCSAWC